MKGKYITTDILMACLSHRKAQTTIHQQLEVTIAEHRKIKQQFFKKTDAIIESGSKKDIHQELAATIATIKSEYFRTRSMYLKFDEAA